MPLSRSRKDQPISTPRVATQGVWHTMERTRSCTIQEQRPILGQGGIPSKMLCLDLTQIHIFQPRNKRMIGMDHRRNTAKIFNAFLLHVNQPEEFLLIRVPLTLGRGKGPIPKE